MIYNGDYRDVIEKASFDVVVTDPPYGIGYKYGMHKDCGGDEYIELLRPLKPYPKAILQYPEEMMKYLVPLFGPPDEVFAWVYNANTPRQFRLFGFWGCDVDFKRVKTAPKNPTDSRVSDAVSHYDWTSDIQQVKNISSEKTKHPCQVPVKLMELVLSFMYIPEKVFDPFMGSGTTGVACSNVGLLFSGAEIDKDYYRIACERIDQAQRQERLFP